MVVLVIGCSSVQLKAADPTLTIVEEQTLSPALLPLPLFLSRALGAL